MVCGAILKRAAPFGQALINDYRCVIEKEKKSSLVKSRVSIANSDLIGTIAVNEQFARCAKILIGSSWR